ncbi:protein-disulfide reductase DsbD domain-containing protein [uncultured Roseobacter sp.]|uniref:protein-disulfide reductase DsbD domain-containing protein n=1 Tax=uncultured Roseobacter sp. TaxID=114847 RepID=UPI00262F2630|nr:protein-disulfide reductase DsbD domain-containing protein [uncultured Roseobacter sp.]
MKNAILFSALISLGMAGPLSAQSGFKEPVTAQVLPGWVKTDGTRVAALHLSLAPGWKTYWRAPGDAGIPPAFDWAGSSNLSSVGISWPAPSVFDQNGMRSIGYENELIIPLTITPRSPGKPVRLSVDMDLGVCSDICVPYELEFEATLDSDASRPTPAIAAALAQMPYSAREAGVTSATCRVEPTEDGIRLEARVSMPSAGGQEVAVIEPGVPGVWVSEADTRRNGNSVVAVSEMIHADGGAIALDRKAIRITVLGSSHAVDIQGCTPG